AGRGARPSLEEPLGGGQCQDRHRPQHNCRSLPGMNRDDLKLSHPDASFTAPGCIASRTRSNLSAANSTSTCLRQHKENPGTMARAVGIDLGTTNSAVAVLEGGEPTIIANAEGG